MGGGKGRIERKKRRRMYWNAFGDTWSWKDICEMLWIWASSVVASVVYSSITCMAQQPSSLQFVAPFISKQRIKVFAELLWTSPAPTYVLNRMLCAVIHHYVRQRQCFAVLKGRDSDSSSVPYDQGAYASRACTNMRPSPAKLHCSSCHSSHLQAACKQNFLKAKKKKREKTKGRKIPGNNGKQRLSMNN